MYVVKYSYFLLSVEIVDDTFLKLFLNSHKTSNSKSVIQRFKQTYKMLLNKIFPNVNGVYATSRQFYALSVVWPYNDVLKGRQTGQGVTGAAAWIC